MKAAVATFSGPALRCWFRPLLLLGLAVAAFGCKPDIGDKCTNSTDCSIAGDRLCDTTQPGGYCTVFNCEPNGCPEKSACVVFGERTCSSLGVSSRFRRTFCMKICEEDNDCRESDSYRCVDLTHDSAWRVVDVDTPTQKVCVVPSTKEVAPIPPDPPVCYPSDASFDVSRPEAGSTVPDADATTTPVPDVAADRAEASSVDRRGDAVDALDSSHVETGADVAPDAQDDSDDASASDASDASDESTEDVTAPDSADGSIDAALDEIDASAADAGADVSVD